MNDDDIDGKFGGVGLVVVLEREKGEEGAASETGRVYLTIREVIARGPAASAGLRTGDRIVAVQGRPIAQYVDLRQAVMAMRGPEGTQVRFTVERGKEAPREVELIRAVVAAPPVQVQSLGQDWAGCAPWLCIARCD